MYTFELLHVPPGEADIWQVYMLQQLDKMTISQAAVFNLQEETNLQGSEYSWLTSCVYVAQLIFQPLSSYALVVFPGETCRGLPWSQIRLTTRLRSKILGHVQLHLMVYRNHMYHRRHQLYRFAHCSYSSGSVRSDHLAIIRFHQWVRIQTVPDKY